MPHRAAFFVSFLFAAVAVAAALLPFPAAAWISSATTIVGAIVIFLFLASILFKGKGPSRTVGDVLLVSVSGILPLPLHFAVLYCWVGIHYSSEAENIPDLWTAFYFSVVTWTTLGFGDIVPSDAARFIVIAEATMGYVVMALLIAAFVEAIKT